MGPRRRTPTSRDRHCLWSPVQTRTAISPGSAARTPSYRLASLFRALLLPLLRRNTCRPAADKQPNTFCLAHGGGTEPPLFFCLLGGGGMVHRARGETRHVS